MRPRVRARRARGRWARGPASPSVVVVEVPTALDFDELDRARLDELGAGDIFPTLVTADDARRYIQETDTGYIRLNAAIVGTAPGSVPPAFQNAWTVQYAGWTRFRIDALPSVTFWNAKAVFEQNDRWHKALEDWTEDFRKLGGAPGPSPLPPGQGTGGPDIAAAIPNLTKLVAVAGVAAAVLLLAPKLIKER